MKIWYCILINKEWLLKNVKNWINLYLIYKKYHIKPTKNIKIKEKYDYTIFLQYKICIAIEWQ